MTLRGRHKRALILDIARKEAAYPLLAEKYEMSAQGVAMFAQRNRDTIEAVRVEGIKSLAGLWSADTGAKLAELEQIYADISEDLEKPGELTPHQVHRMRMGLVKVLHDMSELAGGLTLRTKMEMDAPTIAAFAELFRGDDGNLYGVRTRQGGDPVPHAQAGSL